MSSSGGCPSPHWPPIPSFPRDAFSGTARYYADYRPPYPRSLLDDLMAHTPVAEHARLLDLGCGPGRVGLALAERFDETWAVDAEQEMLDEGRRRTPADLDERIRWICCRAEDLRAGEGSFHLITIAEAFHRMDQRLVAEKSRRWLIPGGCLAILWYENLWHGSQPWKQQVSKIMREYKVSSAPPFRNDEDSKRYMTFEEVLSATGYSQVQSHKFEEPRRWSVEEIVGYFYSVSVCSRHVLGDRSDAFAADVKRAIDDFAEEEGFADIAKFGYLSAINEP